ncbi:MliC family protein [Roseobacter sp. SK209-2-6]|uniref:MliC family protein n=1 Tax=Roseobacter sp. SK209-2-6 TaxID=388739 RepID=UPI0012F4D854|nr:MliC family protein [Roseobacter sp. SK209-2-6]
MRISILALAMFSGAGAATAEVGQSISIRIDAAGSFNSETYVCEQGEPFSVQYVNSGANALAIVPIDDEVRIFVNVVSASGAKYVSGSHVWWTKGDMATLENAMQAGNIENCQVQDADLPD